MYGKLDEELSEIPVQSDSPGPTLEELVGSSPGIEKTLGRLYRNPSQNMLYCSVLQTSLQVLHASENLLSLLPVLF